MFLPLTSRKDKRDIATCVGLLVAVFQIMLSVLVDRLLHNLMFHSIAIVFLIWMSIQTVMQIERSHRVFKKIWLICKIAVYIILGNLDNMIWLGAELRGHRLLLVFFFFRYNPSFYCRLSVHI
jgi:hypothetical protein